MKLRMLKRILLLLCILGYNRAEAHSLPDCKAQLVIHEFRIEMKFRTPYDILELATKTKINLHSQASVDSLKRYLQNHVQVTDSLQSVWDISVGTIDVSPATDPLIGNYQEIVATLYLQPSRKASLRSFVLHCDWVLHQIPNQSILVSVEQDWAGGIIANHTQQVGVIGWDIPKGKIFPLHIRLEQGSWWKGFESMFHLGMSHIWEGTDHLLFVIVLLLPCMLLRSGSRWGLYRGFKASLLQMAGLVTAFTLGHSLTLLVGTLGWLQLPAQPVEVLIAVSILVSAIHAVCPVFYGKEKYIAMGFGLIHGLAFSTVLADMGVSPSALLVSILGFNLGIEAMQLWIILWIIPWLLLLSQTRAYGWVRLAGALLASVAAAVWMAERVSGKGNVFSPVLSQLPDFASEAIGALAILAIIFFFAQRLATRQLHKPQVNSQAGFASGKDTIFKRSA